MSEGMSILVAGRRLTDIMRDINSILAAHGIDDRFGDATPTMPCAGGHWPDPGPYWVACYPVKGKSEAYWVHIDAIFRTLSKGENPSMERQMIGLAKTWNWETAKKMAGIAADVFEGPANTRDD